VHRPDGLGGFFRFALRSLRGTAFSGLLRFSRFITPAGVEEALDAVGRLRALGDPGLDLVQSSLRRSALSFGSSGLKKPSRSMKRPSRGDRLSAATM
jgi:hypothetical protein